MRWWDKRAGELQNKVRSDELDQQIGYDDSAVRKAIVHAREDIVLLLSHISSANRQLWTIKIALLGILIVLIVLIYIVVKTN